MSKELYIASSPHETKVAVLDDDQLVEIYFERDTDVGLVGGRHGGVERVALLQRVGQDDRLERRPDHAAVEIPLSQGWIDIARQVASGVASMQIEWMCVVSQPLRLITPARRSFGTRQADRFQFPARSDI